MVVRPVRNSRFTEFLGRRLLAMSMVIVPIGLFMGRCRFRGL
jgi:hypothetical protein